jgi:23S rRNA (uracil1939-C5)-methyltransferase
MSVSIGDVVKIPIIRLALGGDSVGRLSDGRVCFVRGAPISSEVSVRLSVVKKKFARGSLLTDLKSPLCESASACGGCPWHLSPGEQQRQALVDHVQRGLSRLSWRAGVEALSWGATSPGVGWRRTVRMHWDKTDLGFFSWGTHSIVNTPQCPILVEPLEGVRVQLVDFYKKFGVGQGTVKATCSRLNTVYLSIHPDGGKATPLEANRWQTFCEGLVSAVTGIGGLECVVSGRVLFRSGESVYGVGVDDTAHHIGSFVQANESIHDAFVDDVVGTVGAKQRVVELFSGSGAFTMRLLRAGCSVTAMEGSSEACDALRKSAQPWIERDLLKIQVGRIEQMPQGRFDVCLLDPPRVGAKAVVSSLKPRQIKRIVYVACDFGTLSRDLGILNGAGFEIESVRLFEMFPNSGHVECVVSLTAQVGYVDEL